MGSSFVVSGISRFTSTTNGERRIRHGRGPARNFARTRASIRVCFKFGILSALMNFSGGTPTRNSTCKQKLLPFDYTTTTLARRIV